MELSLTTPAMLFPAISLLLLAYTNRFLTLASVIRALHNNCEECNNSKQCDSKKRQIKNLRKRVHIIKYMQGVGAASFFFCVLSMLLLFSNHTYWGTSIFGISLILLLISLFLSLWEIKISVDALEEHLSNIE